VAHYGRRHLVGHAVSYGARVAGVCDLSPDRCHRTRTSSPALRATSQPEAVPGIRCSRARIRPRGGAGDPGVARGRSFGRTDHGRCRSLAACCARVGDRGSDHAMSTLPGLGLFDQNAAHRADRRPQSADQCHRTPDFSSGAHLVNSAPRGWLNNEASQPAGSSGLRLSRRNPNSLGGEDYTGPDPQAAPYWLWWRFHRLEEDGVTAHDDARPFQRRVDQVPWRPSSSRVSSARSNFRSWPCSSRSMLSA